jgi:hypothetical protein
MKTDWKKLKSYQATNSPLIIEIPPMNYLSIQGKGNPNTKDFQACIEKLYGLAYPIKIRYKKRFPDNDFKVYPLEGIWDLDEEGRKLGYLDKNHLVFELWIGQPDGITMSYFLEIQKEIVAKKKDAGYEKVQWKSTESGLYCQMLHIGSYDLEPETFQIMEAFVEANGYQRISKIHQEIYLSDARKTKTEQLRTILRFAIKKKE